MRDQRRFRQTVALSLAITAFGLTCLGGGLALLAWRLLQPDRAVLLPPGGIGLVEMTPTPGILGTPIAPPPLPAGAAQLVILPESELPTPTPTGSPDATFTVRPRPTLKPGWTATPAPTLTRTPSPTPVTLTAPALSSSGRPTRAPTFTPTPTAMPSPSPTAPPAVPDRIVISTIGLDAPVISVGQHPLTLDGKVYGQWDVPKQRAAGWHMSSAPLGEPGNTVLNGHHNIYGEVFRYLSVLKPGDIITLEARGRRYYYLVAQTMTLPEQGQPVAVRQETARWILPTTDERVTLITCWPYNGNSHRLVVIAMPASVLGVPKELP